jgi:hypothetical protein
MDRPTEPINIVALPGTPLDSAIEPLVEQRKAALGAAGPSLVGEEVNLASLKKTVYGRMILDELELLDKDRLSGKDAKIRRENFTELLRGLSDQG